MVADRYGPALVFLDLLRKRRKATAHPACRAAGRDRARVGAGPARGCGYRYLKTVERKPGGGDLACEPANGAGHGLATAHRLSASVRSQGFSAATRFFRANGPCVASAAEEQIGTPERLWRTLDRFG
jgi:hypothetical protein